MKGETNHQAVLEMRNIIQHQNNKMQQFKNEIRLLTAQDSSNFENQQHY
jgi:hypothetical protein